MATVTVQGETYDIIPSEVNAATKILVDIYLKLGQPKTPLSKQGEKLMDVMIAVWQDLRPIESTRWFEERKDYKNNELTISEQVSKGTGRSLASMPRLIYDIYKLFFTEFPLNNRKNWIELVNKYPIFRMANKV